MEILSQTAHAARPEMTLMEVCYLQSAEETREMDGLLEDYPADSLVLDLIISEWDFTTPVQQRYTLQELWLPSFRTIIETISFLVIRDFMGNYAIYKKA